MRKITRSVIKLSEIPEEFHKVELLGFHLRNDYAEFHIGDDDNDALTLWLLKKYPTLKRKISFFIHIDV
jgi:hypothetical protein